MIAVFVRPATPGRVKTRLIPALGELGAAMLYRAMAQDVVTQAQAVADRAVELWVAGAVDDPDLDYAPTGLPRIEQANTDLGGRVLAALVHGLARGPHAMVLGSDAPGLSAHELGRAFGLLEHADIVLGPAADGGFNFIAARRCHDGMFSGVRVSTRHALTDTRQACLGLGLKVSLASPWFDVDTATDLWVLRAFSDSAPASIPHTTAALKRLTPEQQSATFDQACQPLVP